MQFSKFAPALRLLCTPLLLAANSLLFAQPAKLDFNRDVRPILSENCFHCHGQDSQRRMANLRLDTFAGATEGKRPALLPGQPDRSPLVERITSANPARRMPPPSSNRSLTPAQVETLKQWVASGGVYDQHWAFVPPRRPAVPAGVEPISFLVSQRLRAEGLTLSPPASAAAWLRRATLDLTGLAPTPAELAAFSAKPDYEKAVDRLLASPRFGERLAADWLDVARYADTHGFNNDSSRSMWRWRDWVIASFNRNLPYNRFLTEQLAGDLLPNATLEQRLATGFGRNHVINSEGGIIEEEYRVEYVADRVRTLGMAWLGLTLECARCHDHKYDPISQKDHYRFFAFFNNVSELGEDGRVANAVPFLPAPTETQQAELAALARRADLAQQKMRQRELSWRRPSAPPPTSAASPEAAPVFALDCEAPSRAAFGFTAQAGVRGDACHWPSLTPALETRPLTPNVPVASRAPLSFSLWLRPSAQDTDVALLSTVDYARSMASVRYGEGMELRLVNGELEFRYGQRFPAYAMRVQSEGARLLPDAWRHITLLYAGDAEDKDAMRASAAWVRLFVDGQELPTRILNDGAPLGGKNEKPSPRRFRLGWDNAPNSPTFRGQLDELALFARPLSPAELAARFQAVALPYAFQRAGSASSTELAWLRSADLRHRDPAFAKAEAEWSAVHAQRLALLRQLPTVMVMDESSPRRKTFLLKRGAYDLPGEELEPGVPEALLGPWPAGAPKNRLGLALWLTKPDHPTTARVVVNRFWQHLFGTGLVKTSENFGVQGETPLHPELLDWLARQFIDSGWNVKALLKQIVLSPVYRQDSSASPALLAKDPENRLLARGPRVRLPAEVIRDQALQLSGLLVERVGGPSVYPYQPKDLYKGIVVAADYPGTTYPVVSGEGLYRRSLYTFWKRTVPHPTLTVFDAPDREFCIVRRSSTNTPMQALTLLNDPIFVEAARKLGERTLREGGNNDEKRLAFLFQLATGRPAQPAELAILRQSLAGARQHFAADPEAARALLSVGASPSDPRWPAPELAAFTSLANIILNLDEVITKG